MQFIGHIKHSNGLFFFKSMVWWVGNLGNSKHMIHVDPLVQGIGIWFVSEKKRFQCQLSIEAPLMQHFKRCWHSASLTMLLNISLSKAGHLLGGHRRLVKIFKKGKLSKKLSLSKTLIFLTHISNIFYPKMYS